MNNELNAYVTFEGIDQEIWQNIDQQIWQNIEIYRIFYMMQKISKDFALNAKFYTNA